MIRRLAFLGAGLAVALVLAVGWLLTGDTSGLGRALAGLWPPANRETAVLWSVERNSEALARLSTSGADLGAQIPAPLVVAELRSAFAEARRRGDLPTRAGEATLEFGEPVFELGQQILLARLPAVVVLPQVTVRFEAVAIATATVTPHSILLVVNFDAITIQDVKSNRWWFRQTEELQRLVNKKLQDSLPAINGALSVRYNPVIVPLNRKPLVDTELSHRPPSRDDLQFDQRRIFVDPAFIDSVVLVDADGLRVMTRARLRTPEEAARERIEEEDRQARVRRGLEGVPRVPDRPISPSPGEVSAAYEAFRGLFSAAYESAFGRGLLSAGAGGPELTVSRELLARALNHELSRPLAANVAAAFPPSSFNEAIALTQPPTRQCARDVGVCQNRGLCQNRQACASYLGGGMFTRMVEREFEERVCEGSRRVCNPVVGVLTGGLSCVLEPICGMRKVVRQVQDRVLDTALGPVCEQLGAASRNIPGLCELADQADRLPCNLIAEVGVGACQAGNAVQSTLAANPLARIVGDFSGDLSGRGIISGNVAADLSSVSLRLRHNARGTLRAYLRFEPESIRLVDATCLLNMEGRIDANVAAEGEVATTAPLSSSMDGNRLVLRLAFPEITVPINLDKSPFVALWGENPQMLVQCRLVGAAAALFGTWETIVTEQLRRVSPYVSGRGIPVSIKDISIELPLEPIDILGARIMGQLGEKAITFGPQMSN